MEQLKNEWVISFDKYGKKDSIMINGTLYKNGTDLTSVKPVTFEKVQQIINGLIKEDVAYYVQSVNTIAVQPYFHWVEMIKQLQTAQTTGGK